MRKGTLIAMFAAAVAVQSAEAEKLRLKRNHNKAELPIDGKTGGLIAAGVGAVVGAGYLAWSHRDALTAWLYGNPALEQSLENHGIDPNPAPVAEEIVQNLVPAAPAEDIIELEDIPTEEELDEDVPDLNEVTGNDHASGLQLFRTHHVKPEQQEGESDDVSTEGESEGEVEQLAPVTMSQTLRIEDRTDPVVAASKAPGMQQLINSNCKYHSSCPYVCVATNSVLPAYINQYYTDVSDGKGWSCHKTLLKEVQKISVAGQMFASGPSSQACVAATKAAQIMMRNIKTGKATCVGPHVGEVGKKAFRKGQKGAFYKSL